MLFPIVSILLTVAYAALLLLYWYGWRALPEWRVPEGWTPATRVSVVIPARNEAANIEACLRSILEGSYPAELLEVIVVDDFSEDGTATRVAQFSERWSHSEGTAPIVLLQLSECISTGQSVFSHKKEAIETGVTRATGDLIVTTDADCLVPNDWLRLLVSHFDRQKNTVILTAPVAFHREHNLIQRFQALDFLGLMGITGAGIRLGWQRMGNGANLAYSKKVFRTVDGFDGNKNHASGDDMFLIQKVAARWPAGVFFLKNPAATVLTEAKPGWRAFVQQRLRWGTKNAALPEWPVRLALLTVFLFCWSILLTALLAVAGLFVAGKTAESFHLSLVLAFQILGKATFDFFFLRALCRYFRREDLLRWFVPAFFLHTLYIPLLGAASLLFKEYEWKGRQVR